MHGQRSRIESSNSFVPIFPARRNLAADILVVVVYMEKHMLTIAVIRVRRYLCVHSHLIRPRNIARTLCLVFRLTSTVSIEAPNLEPAAV